VSDALQIAIATATSAGARQIERLTFRLCRGGHVTEDGLTTLVAALSVGTPAEGAEIAIIWREIDWACVSCGHAFPAGGDPTCPRCGEIALATDRAPELSLWSIDIPTDEPLDDRLRDSSTRAGTQGEIVDVSGETG
jgi:Zn finger protein HypA/HybF involved in hydrogenase expression